MAWILVGAILCALSIASGAFGAHALAERLDPRALTTWETGARYLTYAGLGLLFLGLAQDRWNAIGSVPAALLSVGAALFSGSLFALALGAPRVLGAVTPLGGALQIAAWVWFAWRIVLIR